MTVRKRPDMHGRWECSKCKEYKFPNEFSPHPTNLNGLMSRCKSCQNGALKDHRDQMAEVRKAKKARRDRMADLTERFQQGVISLERFQEELGKIEDLPIADPYDMTDYVPEASLPYERPAEYAIDEDAWRAESERPGPPEPTPLRGSDGYEYPADPEARMEDALRRLRAGIITYEEFERVTD